MYARYAFASILLFRRTRRVVLVNGSRIDVLCGIDVVDGRLPVLEGVEEGAGASLGRDRMTLTISLHIHLHDMVLNWYCNAQLLLG
jgi:hypothetical protein